MIEAGAAGVHFEDQLAAEKKCGHLGGKVLVPTSQFVRTLTAARLAADVCGVPTVLVARTDALSATLLTSDVDEVDQRVPDRRAHARGLLPRPPGLEPVDRPLARLRAVRRRALVRDRRRRTWARRASSRRRSTSASRASCSPTTARRRSTGASHLDDAQIASFQDELAALGYRFQFVTLAGFHALNESMFELARRLRGRGHDRLRRAAGARVRARAARLHGDPPPARGRRRLLRRGAPGVSARARRSRSRARPKKPSSSPPRLDAPGGSGGPRPGRHGRSSRPRRSTSSPSCSASWTPTGVELLERRRERQAELDAGALPDFLPETRPSATATGRSRRRRPICRTGGSRSPARSTAR